jgi:hypothetical protein
MLAASLMSSDPIEYEMMKTMNGAQKRKMIIMCMKEMMQKGPGMMSSQPGQHMR